MKKPKPVPRKKASPTQLRDQKFLEYKKTMQLQTEMQDLLIGRLARMHQLSGLEEDYLFDYLLNCMDNITFTQYLKKLKLPFFKSSPPSQCTFKVTIDDGFRKFDYELDLPDTHAVRDIADKLGEMGEISAK
jgi:hypothetical protein